MGERIEIYERQDHKYDWRLVGANGEVMCGSDQGYTDSGDALRGYTQVAMLIQGTLPIHYPENTSE